MSKEILNVNEGAAAISMAKAKTSVMAEMVHEGQVPHVFVVHNGHEVQFCRVVPRGRKAREKWCQKMNRG